MGNTCRSCANLSACRDPVRHATMWKQRLEVMRKAEMVQFLKLEGTTVGDQEAKMRNVTLNDVLYSGLTDKEVDLALSVRGIKLPTALRPFLHKYLLMTLLDTSLSLQKRQYRFKKRKLTLTDVGGGQWQVVGL